MKTNTAKAKNEKVPRVIIIRGTPGTGKTTIAQKVSTLLKGSKKAFVVGA